MPRGDGTGPMGMGPMTGRAAGFCAGYPVPGFMNPVPGGGRGRGFGWGRGRGRGRGGFGRLGRGFRGAPFYGVPYDVPYPPQPTPQEEADALKGQAEYLEQGLEDIRKRQAELEAAQAEQM